MTNPKSEAAGDPAKIRVDSLLIHKNLVLHHLDQVIADAKVATRNRFAFREVGLLASQLDAALRLLGAQQIAAADVIGCTLLHQVRYAMIDAIELIDQYEDAEFPNSLVFAEPYNVQVNNVIQRLRALLSAVQQRVDDFDTLLLKYHNARKHAARDAPVDYAANCSVSAGKTPASLAILLDDGNVTARGAARPVLQSAAAGRWHEVERALHADSSLAAASNGTYGLLHMAVLWQSPFAVALVLGHGADINAQTGKDGLLPSGSTALHYAAASGNAALLKLLLCWGASRDVCDRTGQPPTALPTSRSGHTVLDAATNLQARAVEVCTAAFDGQQTRLFTLLTKYDVAVNVKLSPSSRTFLLHQVALSGDRDSYWLLLEAGASPLLRTKDGQLPSDLALSANHAGLVGLMQQTEEAERVTTADPPPPKPPSMRPLKVPPLGPGSLPCSPTVPVPPAVSQPSSSLGSKDSFRGRAPSPGGISKPTPDSSLATSGRKGSFIREAVSHVTTKLKGHMHRSPSDSQLKDLKDLPKAD
eukprot:EG_transcript_8757